METRFITVQDLGSGFAAVCWWLNTEDFPGEAFWEPWQTGTGRYLTEGEAAEEALGWAWSEELEYVVAIDTDAHCKAVVQQWRAQELSSG